MASSDSLIGIFDSGVGGLTVLEEARKRMPNHSFLYFADRAHAPYGEGSKAKTLELTLDCVAFMEPLGLSGLVLACNTATSAAVKELRNRYDFPVIGMEPAVKPAVERGEGKVLVLATPLTLREEKFKKLVQQIDKEGKVDGVGMPDLVRLAENGLFNGEEVQRYLKQQLGHVSWEDYSAVVLGCTHFIYFREALKALVPDHVAIIDGNEGTVRRLMDQVDHKTPGTTEDQFYDSKQLVAPSYFGKWLAYLHAHD
ncbi:MAG: glutamate racemase [Cytophagales bacterium]|nr:glutamate racemase [Cytophagales bacterium]